MKKPRTIIRIGRQTLTFALPENPEATGGSKRGAKVMLEPYTVKSGMSMAANLREAFKESALLAIPNERVHVIIDTPTLILPIEEFDENNMEELYRYTFPGGIHEVIVHHVMPELNCVAVFAINKDEKLVVSDHYDNVRITPIDSHVWRHLHERSHSGQARKLYAFFHEGWMSVAGFSKNRFRFVNTFTTHEVTDSTYYLLYVWQLLAMDQKKDELYIVGDIPSEEELKAELRKYVQNVFQINPSAEFNRDPITQIPNVTYDLICLCES